MSSKEWTSRILTKLAALGATSADAVVDRDEDEHQRNIREYYALELNAKATLPDVEGFERQHGIRLPEDYRIFVTEIGNGGCGPGDGGLYRFQSSDESDWMRYSLGAPFVVPPRGFGVWPKVPVSDDELRVHRSGLLLLSHYGCGVLACLVVCGARYGEVWIDDLANGTGIFPAEDSWVASPRPGVGPGFLEWYEGWLNQQLAK
jgi:hypothetical protein